MNNALFMDKNRFFNEGWSIKVTYYFHLLENARTDSKSARVACLSFLNESFLFDGMPDHRFPVLRSDLTGVGEINLMVQARCR